MNDQRRAPLACPICFLELLGVKDAIQVIEDLSGAAAVETKLLINAELKLPNRRFKNMGIKLIITTVFSYRTTHLSNAFIQRLRI